MAATNDHATARLRQRKSIDVCLSEIRPNFGHEFDSPELFLRGLEKRVRYSDVKNFFAEFIFPDTRSRLIHEARPRTSRLLRSQSCDRRADITIRRIVARHPDEHHSKPATNHLDRVIIQPLSFVWPIKPKPDAWFSLRSKGYPEHLEQLGHFREQPSNS